MLGDFFSCQLGIFFSFLLVSQHYLTNSWATLFGVLWLWFAPLTVPRAWYTVCAIVGWLCLMVKVLAVCPLPSSSQYQHHKKLYPLSFLWWWLSLKSRLFDFFCMRFYRLQSMAICNFFFWYWRENFFVTGCILTVFIPYVAYIFNYFLKYGWPCSTFINLSGVFSTLETVLLYDGGALRLPPGSSLTDHGQRGGYQRSDRGRYS